MILPITIILIISIVIFVFSYYLFSSQQFDLYKNANKIDDKIDLYYLNGFLSHEDCLYLIKISENNFSDSKVIQGNDAFIIDKNYRTSYSYSLDDNDIIVKKIRNKVSKMLNKKVSCIESLQIVRYLPGQEFKEHHDWFNPDYSSEIKNQRQFTIFCYLNDDLTGGETNFPKINKQFSPSKGDALLWKNCNDFSDCNNLTLHQGKPPIQGIKYGLNIWIRFK